MAKKTKLSAVEREEYRRLSYNLKRRFERIRSRYGENSPAVKRFEMDKAFFGIRGHTEEELVRNFGKLKYIDSLKSSTVKGTIRAMEFQDKMDTIEMELGSDAKETVWKLYQNLVEENGIASKYKYEVLDYIGEKLIQGYDEGEIAQRIRDLADQWALEGGDYEDINPFDILE